MFTDDVALFESMENIEQLPYAQEYAGLIKEGQEDDIGDNDNLEYGGDMANYEQRLELVLGCSKNCTFGTEFQKKLAESISAKLHFPMDSIKEVNFYNLEAQATPTILAELGDMHKVVLEIVFKSYLEYKTGEVRHWNTIEEAIEFVTEICEAAKEAAAQNLEILPFIILLYAACSSFDYMGDADSGFLELSTRVRETFQTFKRHRESNSDPWEADPWQV